jgi:hypothetical protein
MWTEAPASSKDITTGKCQRSCGQALMRAVHPVSCTHADMPTTAAQTATTSETKTMYGSMGHWPLSATETLKCSRRGRNRGAQAVEGLSRGHHGSVGTEQRGLGRLARPPLLADRVQLPTHWQCRRDVGLSPRLGACDRLREWEGGGRQGTREKCACVRCRGVNLGLVHIGSSPQKSVHDGKVAAICRQHQCSATIGLHTTQPLTLALSHARVPGNGTT